jgi:hypothetical protein
MPVHWYVAGCNRISGLTEILVEEFGRHMIDAGGGASCRV